MGKSAPAAPDPTATAQAQATINRQTAETQAELNRINTYGPGGSVIWRNEGAEQGMKWMQDQYAQIDQDAKNASIDGNPLNVDALKAQVAGNNPYNTDRWSQTTILFPEQQHLYDTIQGAETNAADWMSKYLQTDLNTSGLTPELCGNMGDAVIRRRSVLAC